MGFGVPYTCSLTLALSPRERELKPIAQGIYALSLRERVRVREHQ
jgi:hypothetical protein